MNEELIPSNPTESSPSAGSAIVSPPTGVKKAAPLKRKVISVSPLARSVRVAARRKAKPPAVGKGQFKELLNRLQRLRQITRETALAYLTKIDLDLSAIVKRLTDDGKAGKRRPLKGGTLKQMLKLAKKIDLKPAKGRRKDLRKIEKAVAQIKRRMDRK
ncbi:MAG: hypothetical protein HY043_08590 [Verrucomicrobia bacterium]|nr:hypothetical protein [Verrucomicrobiota bacterium]